MKEQQTRPKALAPTAITRAASFKLFSVFGINIYINYTWFIVVILVAWSLASGYFPYVIPDKSSLLYWGLGFLTSIIFFVCILIHEMSHSYTSQKSGIPVSRITLFIFGGVASISREPSDPQTEFKIALAGPLASGILWAIFFTLGIFFERVYRYPIASSVFGVLAIVNAAVALFNLVPGFPLDGGRLLRAYIWKKTKNIGKATFITSQVGKTFAIALIFYGFFQLLFGQIIGGIWLIFIGFFLEQAATSSYQQTMIREGLAGTKVKEIMSPNPISVNETIPLTRLVEDFFFKHRFVSYPVVKDEDFLGYVTLNNVKHLPREQWDKLKVSDVMETLPQELILHPEEEAVEALSKMVRSGRGRLPVVGKERKLIGMLTRRDIMSFLKIRTDLGSGHKEKIT